MAMTYGNDSGPYDASDVFLAASMLNQQIHELLLDTVDLRSVCSYKGNLAGRQSATLQIPQVRRSAMGAANSDETTAISVTDLETGVANITVARQAIGFRVSDLYQIITAPMGMQARDLAQSVAQAAMLRATDIIAALFSSFSSTVGTSGVDLTVDDIMDALYTLEQANCNGPYICPLAPVQFTDLQSSLRGEGGAQMYNPQTLSMLAAYQGAMEWNGITFLKCDSVPTGGGNRTGAMFDLNAIGYADASPSALMGGMFPSLAPVDGSIYVAFERDELEGTSDIVGNYYFGAAILENARGVGIVTDA